MAKKPLISIIMPTLNSAHQIQRSLDSIRKQQFDQSLVEILVVDGGSTDDTRKIAEDNGCIVLDNPLVQPECAKHVGILHAKGKIGVFLDSDEVFENDQALAKRERFFAEQPDVHFLLMGGYRKPAGTTVINDYVNNFADPFSFFMYGTSADSRYYLSSLRKRYQTVADRADHVVFSFGPSSVLPLVDACAGNAADLAYLREHFPTEMKHVNIVPQLFATLVNDTHQTGMLKNDVTVHYTGGTWHKYLNKLKWRVVVNTHYVDKAGVGFANREPTQPLWFRLKKYLFIIYALTFVLPLLVSIYYCLRRRLPVALVHAPLTFYTAVFIVWQQILKALKITPKLAAYGS